LKVKSAQHRLQRTAALPLLCGRGLPKIAQAFKRVLAEPPLPLSQTVSLLNRHATDNKSTKIAQRQYFGIRVKRA